MRERYCLQLRQILQRMGLYKDNIYHSFTHIRHGRHIGFCYKFRFGKRYYANMYSPFTLIFGLFLLIMFLLRIGNISLKKEDIYMIFEPFFKCLPLSAEAIIR